MKRISLLAVLMVTALSAYTANAAHRRYLHVDLNEALKTGVVKLGDGIFYGGIKLGMPPEADAAELSVTVAKASVSGDESNAKCEVLGHRKIDGKLVFTISTDIQYVDDTCRVTVKDARGTSSFDVRRLD